MPEILRYLINKLSDGRFHSGTALGSELDLSRAAISKHIKRINELGLEVHSVHGKGYRLVRPVSLLEKESISKHLAVDPDERIRALEVFDTIDSTNSHAMRMLQEGVLEPGQDGYAIYLAEQQTQGKGRRGRPWISPFASNIYLTMVRQLDAGTMGTEGISLAAGLAVVRALDEIGVPGLGVKWPNDVIHGGEKLAGILMEITGDITGLCQIIIGVGVNVRCPPGSMRQVDQPWTDIYRITGQDTDRNRLAGRLCTHIIEVLDEFEARGFNAFAGEWRGKDIMRDKQVELITSGGSLSGLARGVSDSGALLLETAEGLRSFNGGEISLRGRSAR